MSKFKTHDYWLIIRVKSVFLRPNT